MLTTEKKWEELQPQQSWRCRENNQICVCILVLSAVGLIWVHQDLEEDHNSLVEMLLLLLQSFQLNLLNIMSTIE